jgi:hypothetical protein
MAKRLTLVIYESAIHEAVCRTVNYVGFPFRDLAEKMAPLITVYGSKRVADALTELVVHTGWRTMLNQQARKACWGLLGPPPEKWEMFYSNWFGDPQPRPEKHKVPPVIPPPEPDAFQEKLTRELYPDLLTHLDTARKMKRPEDEKRVASELVRRGLPVPPPPQPKEEKKEPAKKKAKPKVKK